MLFITANVKRESGAPFESEYIPIESLVVAVASAVVTLTPISVTSPETGAINGRQCGVSTEPVVDEPVE